MILHQLTLRDFGLFCGEQRFSLTPRIKYKKRRPIILIGGKNGTGKTTILDAVRLCLYGSRLLGNRVSQKEYHEYLVSTIHHSQSTLIQPKQASVVLEFEHAHIGEKNYYHVERRWELRHSTNGPIRESLLIHKNSEQLSDFEADHWQDFLNELIPIGLSQLFFFDGEKIQGLAEDASSHLFLADSIKSLLGVDLVERLNSDLKIFLNRSEKNFHRENTSQAIISLEEEQQELDAQLSCIIEKKAALETQIVEIEGQVAFQEEKIAKEGGGYTQGRESLKTQQAGLSQRISDLETQIRDECAALFPFALAKSLCNQLRARLIKEADIEKRDSAYRALEDLLKKWESSEPLHDRKKVTNWIKQELRTHDASSDSKYVHLLSSTESRQLHHWIDLCLTDVPMKFQKLSQQLEESNRQLQRVEKNLARIPSQEVLKPLIHELASLHQQLGALQNQVQEEAAKIQSLTYRRDVATRKLRKLNELQRESKNNQKRARLVVGVQSVLDAYATQLTHAKIKALQTKVAECFNHLCRKPGLVTRTEIDPQTFVVRLFDRQDRLIRKEDLSAGEKQIYAISILWGLAKTSGRPLPMIIDTPLSRLDSEHRGSIIEHYFPHASHQMVILSTDSELNSHNLKQLSPHISHAYHLAYDLFQGRSNALEGYYWRHKHSGNGAVAYDSKNRKVQ